MPAAALGEQEKIITKAARGLEPLGNQFGKRDRHARRDLLALAERLGVDLVAGQGDALEQTVAAALSANDEALLAGSLQGHAVPPDRPGEADAGSHPRLKLSRNHSGPARNPIRRTDR